ncbi:MAG: ACT domain-containing protein [Spirochaetales bacterium]|nr:ACT domain-containing protein [Spirochaetales bacterium]
MNLEVLNKKYSLYHIDENREIPRELYVSGFFSATRTDSGLTIICDSEIDFSCRASIDNLKLIRVKESLDFEVAGQINRVSETLAKDDISIMIISTYENFYVAVRSDVLNKAIETFKRNKFTIFYQ